MVRQPTSVVVVEILFTFVDAALVCGTFALLTFGVVLIDPWSPVPVEGVEPSTHGLAVPVRSSSFIMSSALASYCTLTDSQQSPRIHLSIIARFAENQDSGDGLSVLSQTLDAIRE